MDIPKRLWDANVTLAYLSGDPIVYPDCGLIIEQIKTYNYDVVVAREARRLIRTYKPGLKPNDAIHMATALLFEIPILETIDDKLLHLSEKEGNPPLIIRKPRYEGPVPFPSISTILPSPLQIPKQP